MPSLPRAHTMVIRQRRPATSAPSTGRAESRPVTRHTSSERGMASRLDSVMRKRPGYSRSSARRVASAAARPRLVDTPPLPIQVTSGSIMASRPGMSRFSRYRS